MVNILVNTEDKFLKDLLAVKILDILINWNFMPKEGGNHQNLSDCLPIAALAILQRAGIITQDFKYTEEFEHLYFLRKEYLEARVQFIIESTRDVLEFGEYLFRDPERFMRSSSVFAMFDYAKGYENSEEGKIATRKWCTYVSALTDLEAPCLLRIFKKVLGNQTKSDVLEIGGNIGVFAEKFCEIIPNKRYSICDIPVVAALGEMRHQNQTSNFQYEYIKDDMFSLLFGESKALHWDMYIFKSVLHDWPRPRVDEILHALISKAKCGSKVVISERFSISHQSLKEDSHASDAGNFVFSPFYRSPEEYIDILDSYGGKFSYEVEEVWIDMKWFVLVVTKI